VPYVYPDPVRAADNPYVYASGPLCAVVSLADGEHTFDHLTVEAHRLSVRATLPPVPDWTVAPHTDQVTVRTLNSRCQPSLEDRFKE
jgi:hypothetical protein